jgi:hypothetical protein
VKEEGTANIIVFTYFFIARNCRKAPDHHNPDHGERIASMFLSFDAFLDLALDPDFIHWTLLPYLFRAKIDAKEYRSLQKKLLSK